MAELTQKVKVRFEVGPGILREVGAFHTSPAFEAVLAGFFRAMTSETIYPGPDAAFEATHDGVTAKVWVSRMDVGSDPNGGPLDTTRYIECEADVTLNGG